MDGLTRSSDVHVPGEHVGSDDVDQLLPKHSLLAYEEDSSHSTPSNESLNEHQASAPLLATSLEATAQTESPRLDLPALIQVEDNWDDTDSAYNDETQSYTTSLKSSVTKFEYENGRRYHAADGRSWHFLPNDDAEMDRLDLFHHIMHLRCDERLHLAPINPYSQRILDLGTGTGIWAVMMGELYESASVLGNDLSPIQPTLVPPNVSFEVDDMEKEWCYSTSFDYIHCRYLAGAIRDWPKLMRQAYEYTKPGGWVEFKDFTMKFYSTDGSYERSACTLGDERPTPTPSPDRWTTEIITGIKSLGLEPEPGPKLEAWVRDTGFINVVHHLLPIPVGDWPKDKKLKRIGRADRTQFLDGLDAISLRVFTTTRGWRPEEVQVLLADVRRTLQDRMIHAQHDFHVVYGQRPWNT
ncbi:S-adenosyl-L-methionine-dependent methyltransferase [Viridothelium virens]|uniref:S-adenosyl-L-methionine-dependent methyltransferase n=1 Tax=Viridothelium virens TaxID=1048519 RepID=A0A6A6HIC4_VIRVR|nr:S-adenosyl-L-methionine-dependent methyltransferase [Viridothelium virens]